MRAIFRNRGNSCRVTHMFTICVREDAKRSATSLIKLVGISSGCLGITNKNTVRFTVAT